MTDCAHYNPFVCEGSDCWDCAWSNFDPEGDWPPPEELICLRDLGSELED